ncbi:FAD-dependent oxidoreductase, partial [Mycoplasmopsis bovis]|uniref:FAD-dependent oxidoreductase n=1 Tax=Mycoplasmopsis bovis TaxID=28903 RepID=UPI003D2BB96D
RYCPSVEDKIVKFPDKERHQIFFEPETADGAITYVNGLYTSMQIDVQELMIKSIPGLRNARVQKWAYAIESVSNYAMKAVAVEKDKEAIKVIYENIIYLQWI